MAKPENIDFLIVGQGLAGSLLAWRLINSNQKVLVVDEPRPGAASRVAAGLVNPVTGKRLVKEPAAEQYLTEVKNCYEALESQFGQAFFHSKDMLRLFGNDSLKAAWEKRKNDPAYDEYLGDMVAAEESGYPLSGFVQKQTGYLLTNSLLNTLKDWLNQNNAYLETILDYSEIKLTPELSWRGTNMERVIFCEGARVINNPWFGYLPMQPAKGEILTIQTERPLPPWIINNGRWLLPLEEGVFKLGATYEWPDKNISLTENISEKGKTSLLSSLPELLPKLKDYKLLHHAAGIRPNSLDKRPLIGFHAEAPRLCVLNGFGSKGSLLIPYYTKHFVDVLLRGHAIQTDVDIRRVVQ